MKYFWLFFVGVGLLGLGQQVTATRPYREIYANTRFGLTLSYPSGWVVSENEGLLDLLNPVDMSQTIDGPAMAGISVKMIANGDNRSLETIAQLLLTETTDASEAIPLQIVPLTLTNPQIQQAITVYGLPSLTTDYVVLTAMPQRVYMWSVNLGFLVDPLAYRPKYDAILLDLLNTAQWSEPTWGGDELREPVSVAAMPIASEFSYPLGDPAQTHWGLLQAFNHFSTNPRYESYHAAEDWYQRGGPTAGEPVYAVADGVVKYAAAANYPGEVVIVEHLLPNGETWYSSYGHLGSRLVNRGEVVQRRQPLGTIYDWPGNSHLHFEIRQFFITDVINGPHAALTRHRNYPPGPGYWPVGDFKTTQERPLDRGWVEPSAFIKSHPRYQPLQPDTIYGQIKLQGQTVYSDTEVFLSLGACNTQPLTPTLRTKTDIYGYFVLTPQLGEVYPCLQAQRPGYITAQGTDPVLGDMGTITLLAGDVWPDNKVNIFDLSLMAAHYQTAEATLDLNNDGQVSILDLVLTASNYGQHGPLTRWE